MSAPPISQGMRPLYSVITALGRPEYHYLEHAAGSIEPLTGHSDSEGAGVQWVLGVDLDPDRIEETSEWLTANSPCEWALGVNSLDHRGPAPARNAALDAADGVWTLTLDSDDVIYPDAVGALREAAWSQGVPWGAGRTVDIDADGTVVWHGPPDWVDAGLVPPGAFRAFQEANGTWPFHCSATIARTGLLRAVGGWPDHPVLRRNEDTGLWSVLTSQATGVWLPQTVLGYRKHSESMTARAAWASLDERLDVIDEMVRAGCTNPYLRSRDDGWDR